MPKFIVDVSWTMFGTYEIEADTKTEAERKAYEMQAKPENGEYVKKSFVVDSVYEQTQG